jgi:hypothetical protein
MLCAGVLLSQLSPPSARALEAFCPGGVGPDPAVIWCDDFEDVTPLREKYYDYDDDGGEFVRVDYERLSGSQSLRSRWQPGEIDAGHLFFNFGRNPLGSQAAAGENLREVYWRLYVKLQDGFVDHPDKLTRATVFAGSNWQQAMIAHVWASGSRRDVLMLDPASGVDGGGNLVTTKWNDFANLAWLGGRPGAPSLAPGRWYCVETHVKLNTPGQADGVFEFWVDQRLEARRADLNWVKTWTAYGLNSILLETYWNQGSPATQERYLDDFVVSRNPIGCRDSTRPNPPTNLRTAW